MNIMENRFKLLDMDSDSESRSHTPPYPPYITGNTPPPQADLPSSLYEVAEEMAIAQPQPQPQPQENEQLDNRFRAWAKDIPASVFSHNKYVGRNQSQSNRFRPVNTSSNTEFPLFGSKRNTTTTPNTWAVSFAKKAAIIPLVTPVAPTEQSDAPSVYNMGQFRRTLEDILTEEGFPECNNNEEPEFYVSDDEYAFCESNNDIMDLSQ
jgi:hypothetical protein